MGITYSSNLTFPQLIEAASANLSGYAMRTAEFVRLNGSDRAARLAMIGLWYGAKGWTEAGQLYIDRAYHESNMPGGRIKA